MKNFQKSIRISNKRIHMANRKYHNEKIPERESVYLRALMDELANLDQTLNLLMARKRTDININYQLVPNDAVIDVFLTFNKSNAEIPMVLPPNTTLYSLGFPYSGIRGPREEIEQVLTDYLGKTASALIPFILGNEPLDILPGEFKATSILKPSVGLDGTNTLIGIIDTGIDYTSPVFIDLFGETRIVTIWDQTIGTDSPYGYGTVYDKEMINKALKAPDPFAVIPHKDEWGHGTILAGIAAGSGTYKDRIYKGAAPKAEIAVVKLKPASETMQKLYYGKYNPLGFSALDIALGFQFLADFANEVRKPISICLPMGTNSGSHDGTNILDSVISSYSSNPGICTVLSVGEEANKSHHASGDLKEEKEQKVTLTIPKGQMGFVAEIWAQFGDQIEVLLTPPQLTNEILPSILLNESQTIIVSETSTVWSQGSEFDVDTGCQVIRFRFENPIEGEWIITIKGIVVIEGIYNIWIPKTGMIMPETILSPASPFTTIYNTSAAKGVIAIGCYDKKSLSACASSGRGFTRDNRVRPDYVVGGVDIPGPLPDNKWGTISGTAPSSAITVGVTSLIYEKQLAQGDELANTIVMKAILGTRVNRQPTVTYPNPSSGYGVLDINSDLS